MAEKIMRLNFTRSGKIHAKPRQVTLSIRRQDSVVWESAKRFRVTSVAHQEGKRGPRTGPFFRPFPAREGGFGNRVSSGPPRPGTARAKYKVSFEFSNRQKYDPIIIIDQ